MILVIRVKKKRPSELSEKKLRVSWDLTIKLVQFQIDKKLLGLVVYKHRRLHTLQEGFLGVICF